MSEGTFAAMTDVRELYAQSRDLTAFTAWTADALAVHGFEPGNALSIVGVCRDELMFPVEHALHEVWGPAFDMSSLGGLVFLGRSGLAAAAHHAPGADGHRRFVIVVMPHIGIDDTGRVGAVVREGQPDASTACGALVGFQSMLATGERDVRIDWDDLEMSLLSGALWERIGSVDAARAMAGDLWALTDLARAVASDEILRLSADLLRARTADVAVFSCVVIHGPHGDRVHVADASVWLTDDPLCISLL